MAFWIAAIGVSAMVAFVLLAAYLRPRDTITPAAAHDIRVYRDQLKHLDRDVARGVVTVEEATRVKTEIARRILASDQDIHAAPRVEFRRSIWDLPVIGGAGAVMLGGAFVIYMAIGAPGYRDLPLQHRITMVEEARAIRPSQDTAEAQIPFRQAAPEDDATQAALVARLRDIVAERPTDTQGLTLLAISEAALGNFQAAHQAQAHLITQLGDTATGRHHIDHAEMMILAAGGYVSPEAENALAMGLALSPYDATGRYYQGLMFAQQGRPDRALPIWQALLADSTVDDPWVDPIVLQIEDVARLAGAPVRLGDLPQPRATALGPSQADVIAAQDMLPEDRLAMIENMVEGLAQRLGAEGGPPEDWARLIQSHLVLGQRAAAQTAYDEARVIFADTPQALALINQAVTPLAEVAE